jgi:alpha-1,6-mannosyltransferase
MVMRAAAAAGRQVPVGLLLVGDGVARRKLERVAERFAHVAVLPHLGDRSELARLLASTDALVHGCEAETFCMVAAEARASGIPLIVPDRGAALDQRVAGSGATYESGKMQSLEQAIVGFADRGIELQRAASARQSRVRTMDEHFADLFARYRMLSPRRERIAVDGFATFERPALASSALHRAAN